MKKVVMVPLDERPCNYLYPQLLPNGIFDFVLINREFLGQKKSPADFNSIVNFLKKETGNANYLVISLDMLLFGGIVPSRLHEDDVELLSSRLELLQELKVNNPQLHILAFELIMRCPFYSSSDEEPEYYALDGSNIHKFGYYGHKESLHLLSEEEKIDFEKVKKEINYANLKDFIKRRKTNLSVLKQSLHLLKNGTIDFFIVPQDDSSPFGFTVLDQQEVLEFVNSNKLTDKFKMYPAADDTGMSLLAHAANRIQNKKPKMYSLFACEEGKHVIPSYECQSIDLTIKEQIEAAGGMRVNTEEEADIILAINIGSNMVTKDDPCYEKGYHTDRDLQAFVKKIKVLTDKKKLVALADVAYPNEADEELISLLATEKLLYRLTSYAGWNTSSNSLGTAIAQAVMASYSLDTIKNKQFLTYRYYEDFAYMAKIRKQVTDNYLSFIGCDYFNTDGEGGKVSYIVTHLLKELMETTLPVVAQFVKEIKATMPWKRMFEVELEIKFQGDLC